MRELVHAYLADPTCELEARFGTCHGGKFVPGVSEEILAAVDAMLTQSPVFRTSLWQESHDAFFNDRLRTSVVFDTETFNMHTVTVRKEPVKHLLLPLHDGIVVKFALAREVPVKGPAKAVDTTFFRLKQRKSHVYFGKANSPFVSYDLSRTWSSTTKSDAERKQRNEPPVFELELELKHNAFYTDADQISSSFLAKVRDLAVQNAFG